VISAVAACSRGWLRVEMRMLSSRGVMRCLAGSGVMRPAGIVMVV